MLSSFRTSTFELINRTRIEFRSKISHIELTKAVEEIVEYRSITEGFCNVLRFQITNEAISNLEIGADLLKLVRLLDIFKSEFLQLVKIYIKKIHQFILELGIGTFCLTYEALMKI